MTQQRPAAVLWDLDGTLIDTEPLWKAGEYALVAEYGGTWSEEHANAIIGNDLLTAAEYIRVNGGVALAPIDIVERLVALVTNGIGGDPPWRPGALALLAELGDKGIPCALVTMSWRRLADHIVALLPEDVFQAVVAGDQVANGKPHPEPYLKAASLLGVDPADCIAIEDSPTGADSANAAGCTVLAVPNLVDIPQRQGRVIMSSLSPVDLATLRRMFRR